MRLSRIIVTTIVALILAAAAGRASAAEKLKAEDVPKFQWRARAVSAGGQKPDEKGHTFGFGHGPKSEATGDAWTEWAPFSDKDLEFYTGTHSYPNIYLKGFPFVIHMTVAPVVDPTVIEAEVKFDGRDEVFKLPGELMGPTLGLLIYKEGDAPKIATMAQYNRRYWEIINAIKLAKRPQKFPIIDRFINADSDRVAWREGIETLSRAGFSSMMLNPDPKIREMLLAAGGRRTAWAVYNPPGYVFAHAKEDDKYVTPEMMKEWARKQSDPFLKAGYAREDMAVYAMSDEPGWYYPAAFKQLMESPTGPRDFHAYLQQRGLAPADLGAKSWEEVQPTGQNAATDLPSKRRFYWTMRYFAWTSSRHFANSTRELEEVFYPNIPIFTNWNFFAGRLYVPGPVANNSEKTNPDAGMGGHDWLEFGRMRGGTMLWTEDWFGDEQAYQWSFYASKLRSAARLGGVEFGGYVIPRTAGSREDGVLQKILAVVGTGGKAVKYFVFGPEYNFPGNCYSENIAVLPKMAEAHGMIAEAEDLLWPGRMEPAKVAILSPRSSQMWDVRGSSLTSVISDATNTNLNGHTVDYMAEVFNLYTALQHANIPVDFVDEDDLTPRGLKGVRVLYVTEPDVPAEGHAGLAEWVKAGGTLVTVAGAAQSDRYGEPDSTLARALGFDWRPVDRVMFRSLGELKPSGKVDGELGGFTAVGSRQGLSKGDAMVGAKFDDGSPAILRHKVGQGQAFHYAFFPGLSYAASAQRAKGKLPTGWSESARKWIAYPVEFTKVERPATADRALVETPVLLSEGGAAVTVLNWNNQPIETLKLSVSVPFEAKAVRSVKRGELKFKNRGGAVECELPVGAADIVMITK